MLIVAGQVGPTIVRMISKEYGDGLSGVLASFRIAKVSLPKMIRPNLCGGLNVDS
ncbi:hypothetical protein PZT66_23910 [Pseudomonas aeruginosa]|uniref:hypothetical protein n=1 Tax=Pseudomonas aeruginosa TaxID=287 RepID=UPI000A7EE95B|nr:hypothetical protein [Pseudomonas aeruginosa]ELD5772877.1 hypothetical protein [Pseudomonas aeruginosa]MBA5210212.1 hypothetical protein [Pseudomonas aeruginosa]MBG3916855.1 hypothetical protein [Pseudomonas aeruginosa]MBG4606544.1 hypothetical protein [Pseudomonas aeruginosa]MBG5240566.1 hypothetical protein [Pseudomonas aeruginosa]